MSSITKPYPGGPSEVISAPLGADACNSWANPNQSIAVDIPVHREEASCVEPPMESIHHEMHAADEGDPGRGGRVAGPLAESLISPLYISGTRPPSSQGSKTQISPPTSGMPLLTPTAPTTAPFNRPSLIVLKKLASLLKGTWPRLHNVQGPLNPRNPGAYVNPVPGQSTCSGIYRSHIWALFMIALILTQFLGWFDLIHVNNQPSAYLPYSDKIPWLPPPIRPPKGLRVQMGIATGVLPGDSSTDIAKTSVLKLAQGAVACSESIQALLSRNRPNITSRLVNT